MTPFALSLAVALSAASGAPPGAPRSAARLSPRHPLVLLAPSPEATRAALVVRFHTGSVDDGDMPGLTLVTQQALLKASRRVAHPDLVRMLVGADASIDLDTGLTEATFTLESGREDFARLSRVLLDLLFAPALDPAAFSTARQNAQHAEREGTGRDILALIASKAIDDPEFGIPPFGTEAGIELVRLEDVEGAIAARFSPANATVVATGGFDAAALRKTLARFSGGSQPRRAPPTLSVPFSLQIPARREIYLVAFRAAFATPDDVAVGRLAATLLEERIGWSFRDKWVGYSVGVDALHRPWIDLLAITLPARAPTGRPLGGMLEEEITAVRDGRFSAEDFERNRSFLLASFARTLHEPLPLALELARGDGKPWFGPDVEAALGRLDRDGFAKSVGRLLAEEGAVRILYSPNASTFGAIPEAYRRTGVRE